MSIVLDGSVGISGIGTLTGVTSISSTTADTPVILQDSSSNSNTCRAWVNFDGTTNVGGFCTIRADFNVSSVTDSGTGDYIVNFTTAMPDANYSPHVTYNQISGATNCGFTGFRNPTTSGFSVMTLNSAGNFNDGFAVSCAVFR
jgi:hypothetical protein